MFTVKEYAGYEGRILRYGKLTKDGASTGEAGRALVFLPGLGGSVKGSLPFLEALLLAYDTIYGLDLRSFGLNFQEEPLRSPLVIYEDLKGFLASQALDRHSALDLAGLSLGGIMATLLAEEMPERFNRLLLMAPAFQENSLTFTPWYTYRNIYSPLLLKRLEKVPPPFNICHVTRNPMVLEDPQYRDGPQITLRPEFLLGLGKLCRLAYAKVRQLQVPTMMVIPGGDIVCCPKVMAEAFHRIPPSTPKRCKTYSQMYHGVVTELEAPEVIRDYLTWLYELETLPVQPVHKTEAPPPRI